MNVANYNSHSMCGELLRVLVCPPRNAGWYSPNQSERWAELGFHHAPVAVAQAHHDVLCRLLRESGAEVICLPIDDTLTLDAAYTHDASIPTNHGVILMHPGKENRIPEAAAHRSFLEPRGCSILGEIHSPGKSEAGDMVWLDALTLLVGLGYRTNQEGIEQMRALLNPHGVTVLSAPLPYGPGPSACLHLMSLMSVLDDRTILVDLPWLAVETVELLRARGFRLIEIDYAERDTLACNVLSLGRNRLVALEENPVTNQRMRAAGFDVATFCGSELCINGSGGPTCLTRPLQRK